MASRTSRPRSCACTNWARGDPVEYFLDDVCRYTPIQPSPSKKPATYFQLMSIGVFLQSSLYYSVTVGYVKCSCQLACVSTQLAFAPTVMLLVPFAAVCRVRAVPEAVAPFWILAFTCT